MKIEVTGTLQPGVFAKDVILSIIGKIGVNGATNRVIEFTGPVVDALSMNERMTLCNMAVEAGATSGICFPDMTTVDYLWPFISNDFSSKEDALSVYGQFISDPDAEYVEELVHNVDNLTPLTTIGYKPDQSVPVGELDKTPVDQVYIGSCTNGRIDDLRVAADILKGNSIAETVRGILAPATPKVYRQALEEGLIDIFLEAGYCVTNPTCGACLGMSNGVLADGEVCASTTNRNFNGRMGKGGMLHLMSPATAAATSITGYISNSNLFRRS